MSRGRAEAALAVNTLVWGSTFVLAKAALVYVSPVLFLAARFSLASVALLLVFPRVLRLKVTRDMIGGGALTGFFLFLGFLFQTLGLQSTTPAKSAFSSTAAFTICFAVWTNIRIRTGQSMFCSGPILPGSAV